MGDTENNKTSDEIINELFSSLNVPLSPKPQEAKEGHDKEGKFTVDIADSDNSEDDESDSKSSASEEEVKNTSKIVQDEAQVDKIDKRKSQKKKKDKKKKKRRRRKKADGGRHKHKKRKKEENIEPSDDQHVSGDLVLGASDDEHVSEDVVQELDNRHISDDVVQAPPDDVVQAPPDDVVQAPPDDVVQAPPDDVVQAPPEDLVQAPPDNLVQAPPDNLVQESAKAQHLSADLVQKSPEDQRLSADLMQKPPDDQDLSSCLVLGTEVKNQVLIKKLIVQEEMKKAQSPDVKEKHKSISKSEKLKLNCSLKNVEIDTKNKVASRFDVDKKDESQPKHGKTDRLSKSRSPALPVSHVVNNVHSRPEPLVEARTRSPKSRSRSRSRRTENERSLSRRTENSRSRSKSKSWQKKPSTRSTKASESHKRSSRSHSRSLTPKHTKKRRASKSRSRSSSRRRSISKRNSRSRSKRNSRSRSKSNSRSRSKINSRSTSKRNARSSSKRNSRSSSIRNSRSRSKRSSRSRSKINSRSTSKRNSRSRSIRNSRSRSKVNSQSDSKRNSRSRSKRRSRSRSQRRSRSRRRSVSKSKRSNSKSPKISSFSNETFNLLDKIVKNSSITGELKGLNAKNLDLNCIPPLDPGPKARNSSRGVIELESIPLPIPALTIPDPSSIPLPQPVSELDGSLKEFKSADGVDLDLKAIPIPLVSGDVPNKEQDSCKAKDGNKAKQEEVLEKGKVKTIIIKSLKDSLVFLQAQEEAQRRAKEIADHHENRPKDADKQSDADLEEKKEEVEKREKSPEKNVEEDTAEKDVSVAVSDLKVEITDVVEEKKEILKTKQEAVGNNAEEIKDKEETKKSEVPVTAEVKKNGEQKVDDIANGMEEGEIASEDEEPEGKPVLKSHSKKKSKKNKNKSKEKRKSRKDKEKSKDDKKRDRERSRSRERDRTRSRSREKHKSRRHSSSRNKDRDYDRRHRRHSRSRSRDRSSRLHHKSYSRSRSRSKSRSRRTRDPTADLRDKVTRKRLLEIARRNAVYLMQNGCLPPSVEQEQLVKIKAGGKSVDELTDFCKQLVASGNYSDVDLSDPSLSSGDDNENSDKPFSTTRHPFSVRDAKPILMNIRNAPMLPTKTNAERLAGQAKLREQFPVSSGSQHRTKGELTNTDGKHQPESDWVPVPPKEKKEEDKVFPQSEPQPVDISQIVSTRLSAMRKLQDNPHDSEAIKTLHNVQKEMQNWALSKQEPAPGQFTGTTGVKVLSQEELSAGHQAWARKEQLKEAAPIKPQFGLKMLQKMGWSPGEGLGKNKEGTIEPLLLDVKMDKKGFHAQEELTPKKQPIPLAKDLSGKHPVSALVELCSKRKWSPPDFEMVFDCGPDHKKNFLMKVMVNGQEFKPSVAASTKKMAKANAAAAYLQSLGLFPKDPNNPLL